MLKSEDIIKYMPYDMGWKTLKHEMLKYTDIETIEVQDIFRDGVKGDRAPLVAWILEMTKFIPNGYVPKKRVMPIKEQQLSLVIKDQTRPKRLNTIRVREIINIFGGTAEVARVLGVHQRTVDTFPHNKSGRTTGYFPEKHLVLLMKASREFGLGITRDELLSLLPLKKARIKNVKSM